MRYSLKELLLYVKKTLNFLLKFSGAKPVLCYFCTGPAVNCENMNGPVRARVELLIFTRSGQDNFRLELAGPGVGNSGPCKPLGP